MTLPRTQSWFLWTAVAFGLIVLLSGIWEFWLSGAVHELACGGMILLLALVARRVWSQQPEQAES